SSIASLIENDVEQKSIEQPLISALLNSEPVSIPSLDERLNSPSAGGFFSSWIPVFGFSTNSVKSQDTPEFYVEKLTQRNIAAKSLAERLQSLRVTLSTAKLSWIKNFIDCKGLAALEFVLERYTIGIKKNMSRNTDHDGRIQSECVRCLRVLLNTELGYNQVSKSSSLINCIVFCMHTPNNKLRSQVADVLAALCVLSLEGHKLVLDAFSDFRQVHEEKFRFQYLMNTLKIGETEDSVSMEYKSACLSLVNAIVTSPEDVEERMMLRKEFERRGLTDLFL
ncbi:3877_t:CDS:2, partial [Acaulospora morrowiae]